MDKTYIFLLDLAVILLSTKAFGLITRRFHMPQVVGALVAGLLLGPACFGIVSETEFLLDTAEIGVIVLMFCAGMETDVDELKKSGKASFIIALLGVIIPLVGGFLVAFVFNRKGVIDSDASCSLLLQNIFMGIILTATSVSITVETLREMGKLKSRAGSAILGAAIIDDILGIIALTIITSLADESVNVVMVLLKILGFFVFVALVAVGAYFAYEKWLADKKLGLQRYIIFCFVFCLLMSYVSEKVFGVADITGAYFAGLIIAYTSRTKYLYSRFNTLSYMYLSPLFFASIGLKVVLPSMSGMIIVFAIAFTCVAILTKVVGCGLGARFCDYDKKESIQIGVGMVSRGEVALIVASKGASVGLIGTSFLGPVVLVVVITTIVSPLMLKAVFDSSNVEEDRKLIKQKSYAKSA